MGHLFSQIKRLEEEIEMLRKQLSEREPVIEIDDDDEDDDSEESDNESSDSEDPFQNSVN